MTEKPAIFFCTLSSWGAPTANAIQTRAMSEAFSHSAGRLCITFRQREANAMESDMEGPYEIYELPCKKNRISIILYSVHAFLLYCRLSISNPFEFVFTRSIIFCLLVALVRKAPLALELHTGVRGWRDRILFRFLRFRGVHFICISGAIASELAAILSTKAHIHIAHDGHNFPIIDPEEVGPTNDDVLKVGYFGSLTPQKGLKLIQGLVDEVSDFEFHVFSKETEVLRPGQSLKDYRFIRRPQVFSKMSEMDVLLLTVVPQGSVDKISSYTSPLKLYEYLAAGRPILVSDLAVLREDLDDDIVYFCGNTVQEFASALHDIQQNRVKAREKATNGLNLAKERTWNLRSQFILQQCGVI